MIRRGHSTKEAATRDDVIDEKMIRLTDGHILLSTRNLKSIQKSRWKLNH
jgi:hypothetical protein